MFYYLYEIKNNLNGKIYVGVHKTNDLNDGYMGSGKVINAAIKKYGIENFTKVRLEQFADATAMYAREKEVVTDEFLLQENVYNLRRGGSGGFDYINKNKYNNLGYEKSIESRIESLRKGRETQKRQGHPNKQHLISGFKNNNQRSMLEKSKSPAAIEKRKNTFKEIGHAQGEKNSQYGTMWITNGLENKKIKKTDSIPKGFRKGRQI